MENEKRLIDADALMRRLRKRREDFASGWRTLDAMPKNAQIQYHENLECALIVEDIPIVDAVEVVHGRWLRQDEHDPDWWGYTDTHLYCSACLEEANSQYNYCPNCGAKMDGERKDNA